MDVAIHTRFPRWIPESIAGVGSLGAMDSGLHRGPERCVHDLIQCLRPEDPGPWLDSSLVGARGRHHVQVTADRIEQPHARNHRSGAGCTRRARFG
jgi:hypothetical protein